MASAQVRRFAVHGIGLIAAGVVVGFVIPTDFVRSQGGLDKQLARLRFVTGAYHNEQLAVSAGFEAESGCVSSPNGGMGYHYSHRGRIEDDAVAKDQPEILLYGPGAGEERQLVGVEYWKPDDDQDVSTDADRPSLFGRPFDGPMEGHAPGMPIHYDLHVWVWKPNPSGVFAPFNPRLRCPNAPPPTPTPSPPSPPASLPP